MATGPICCAAAVGLAVLGAVAGLAAEGTGEPALDDLLAGRFRWRASQPLIAPMQRPAEPWTALKDPSVVFHGGKWHAFCTLRAPKANTRTVYSSFADWGQAARAEQRVLPLRSISFAAPQVFYLEPHKKWYLICQATDEAWDPRYQPAYSTSDDIAAPDSWAPLTPLGARQAGKRHGRRERAPERDGHSI